MRQADAMIRKLTLAEFTAKKPAALCDTVSGYDELGRYPQQPSAPKRTEDAHRKLFVVKRPRRCITAPLFDIKLMKRLLLTSAIMMAVSTGCVPINFSEYHGNDSNSFAGPWPTGSGAMADTSFAVPVYRGWPERPYELLGSLRDGRENTQPIRPNGKVQKLKPLLAEFALPEGIDERAYYMTVAVNAIAKEGDEFAGMTQDQILLKRALSR